MDKDSYFVPAGYDTLEVLRSYDIKNDLKTLYDEKIFPAKQKSVAKEEEVICEDLNSFLKKFVDKTKKLDDKMSKMQIGNAPGESKTDYSSNTVSQNTEAGADYKSKMSNLSSGRDIEKENSSSKVNFDIFKQSAGSSSKLAEVNESKMTTEEKLVNYSNFYFTLLASVS
jgi:hypothetical protein